MSSPSPSTSSSSSSESKCYSVTCTAPVNIAVIKYWGKRDEQLILPINSSLSGTLNQRELCTRTTITADAALTSTTMLLNGRTESTDGARFRACLAAVRARAREQGKANAFADWHLRIESTNNFPTAAGLASSASGLACLAFALARLYGVDGDVSDIARQGSGSACRSLAGGFVAWDKGERDDGVDSRARQVAPETHWPAMRVLVMVVNDARKSTSSTAGMQTSVATSALIDHRARVVVPERMARIERAIAERDFATFAEVTMRDSNQFHAICLDTDPPIAYLTAGSHAIIRLVNAFNRAAGRTRAAYTFDAGPNAVVYVLDDALPLFVACARHYFPPQSAADSRPSPDAIDALAAQAGALPPALLDACGDTVHTDVVKYFIATDLGPGPQVVEDVHAC